MDAKNNATGDGRRHPLPGDGNRAPVDSTLTRRAGWYRGGQEARPWRTRAPELADSIARRVPALSCVFWVASRSHIGRMSCRFYTAGLFLHRDETGACKSVKALAGSPVVRGRRGVSRPVTPPSDHGSRMRGDTRMVNEPRCSVVNFMAFKAAHAAARAGGDGERPLAGPPRELTEGDLTHRQRMLAHLGRTTARSASIRALS